MKKLTSNGLQNPKSTGGTGTQGNVRAEGSITSRLNGEGANPAAPGTFTRPPGADVTASLRCRLSSVSRSPQTAPLPPKTPTAGGKASGAPGDNGTGTGSRTQAGHSTAQRRPHVQGQVQTPGAGAGPQSRPARPLAELGPGSARRRSQSGQHRKARMGGHAFLRRKTMD